MSLPTSSFERLPRQGLLLLAALALGWGFNWPVTKFLLGELPPLTLRISGPWAAPTQTLDLKALRDHFNAAAPAK